MNAETAPKAGWREWVGFAVLALPTLLLALDASVLFLALPQLSADLEPSSSQQLWITDIYEFMIAGFLSVGTNHFLCSRAPLAILWYPASSL